MASPKRTTTVKSTNNNQEILKLLKTVSELPLKVQSMMNDYQGLVNNLQSAKEDMSLGLDAYSLDIEEQKKGLNNSLTEETDKVQFEIEQLQTEKKEAEKKYKRELEDLQYSHNQNIERENEKAWLDLSNKLKKSTSSKEEEVKLKGELEQLSKSFSDKVNETIESVKLELARENELKALKKDSEQINQLNNLQYQLTQAIELRDSYKARMLELEAHVKEIPNMIKNAVEAASKPISINTENKK